MIASALKPCPTQQDSKQQVVLSPDQEYALKMIEAGHNVLITGPAGTGKSFLLNLIREQYRLPVTATTGIAAVNVSGQTIHSWAGLGLGTESAFDITQQIVKAQGRHLNNIVKNTQLAIDEISMMSGSLFSKIDGIFKFIKNRSEEPFGGIQLIMFGDFLQLPPVSRDSQEQFCFETKEWEEAEVKVITLTTTHRQSDKHFIDALLSMRVGNCTPHVSSILQSRYQQKDPNPDIKPVILYTTNKDVNNENDKQIAFVQSPLVTYISMSGSKKGFKYAETNLEKNCLAPNTLNLKIGAQVMLLYNLDINRGLVNGSLGKIEDFVVDTDQDSGILCTKKYPLVKFTNGETQVITTHAWECVDPQEGVIAWYKQIPLKLAYSLTVHKTQGMTLDKIKVYLQDCFAPGQAYVAVSRVKTLEGLFVESGSPTSIMAHPKALEFYEKHKVL